MHFGPIHCKNNHDNPYLSNATLKEFQVQHNKTNLLCAYVKI